jgi:Flp pilus assembly protein TadG
MWSFLTKWQKDESGALAIALSILLPVIVTAVGVGVDLGRAYVVQDRLSRALDASALAAASSTGSNAVLEDRFQDFFAANYPPAALGDPYNLSFAQTEESVTVSASADVATTFMSIVGVDHLTVDARAVVVKALRGLEVALVLDNTGSMWSTMNGQPNIYALKTAATNFVDILFDRVEEDNQVRIGIVPYAAVVNPGAAAVAITNNPYATPYVYTSMYAPYSTTDNAAWKGCVFERAYPNDIQDTSTAAGGLWQPFRWPDTPSSGTTYDNNWLNNNGTLNLSVPSGSPDNTSRNSNAWRHPNLGCPTPIVPLSSNHAQLLTEVSNLTAWNRGGTMGSIGLSWGVRVLSPQAPFTEGHPYDREDWRKIIVMMTDGNNEVYCYPNANNCNSQNYSDETAFRRVGANVMGTTTRTGMLAAVNTRMTETCNYAKSLGITVYTITFANSLNQATRDLYRNCASDAGKYYNAPTQADLISVFEQISRELSNLHIAQ